jgi:hypothetical protein
MLISADIRWHKELVPLVEAALHMLPQRWQPTTVDDR